MEEIIARRKGGLLPLYIGVIIFAAVLGIFAIVELILGGSWELCVFMLVCMLSVVGVGIWVLVGFVRTPKIAITYDSNKDKICFSGILVCSPSEIVSVRYECVRARLITYRWGKIIVKVAGREIKYNYIADVADVHDRLLQLMLEAKEKN